MTPFIFRKRDLPQASDGISDLTTSEVALVAGGDPPIYKSPGGTTYTRYEITGGFGYSTDD